MFSGMILQAVGCGTIAQLVLSDNLAFKRGNITSIHVGWGIAVTMGVLVAGGVTGRFFLLFGKVTFTLHPSYFLLIPIDTKSKKHYIATQSISYLLCWLRRHDWQREVGNKTFPGGHINPAFTVVAVLIKHISLAKLPFFWMGQYLGAWTGAGIVYVIYYGLFVFLAVLGLNTQFLSCPAKLQSSGV